MPVLLMTATASKELIMDHYPLLSGHQVLEKYISWPDAKNMKRLDVFLDVQFGTQNMKTLKSLLKELLPQVNKKAIVYENNNTTKFVTG